MPCVTVTCCFRQVGDEAIMDSQVQFRDAVATMNGGQCITIDTASGINLTIPFAAIAC